MSEELQNDGTDEFFDKNIKVNYIVLRTTFSYFLKKEILKIKIAVQGLTSILLLCSIFLRLYSFGSGS